MSLVATTDHTEKKDKALICSIIEPKSVSEALESEHREEWITAMNEEYASLLHNQTWELVPLPAGKRVIDTKWVFKVKKKPDGSLDRFKSRLVARGYKQRKFEDYNETYSPVIRFESIRILLSIAAHLDLEIWQIDVTCAYLNGTLDEEIYISQPELFSDGSDRVCKLKRSLYGLLQSARQWNKKMTEVMLSLSFTQSKTDPCVFISSEHENMYLGVYVDDYLLTATTITALQLVVDKMATHFQVKAKGVEKFVGLEVTRNRDKKIIVLTQRQYIADVLNRFKMLNAKTKKTPADTHDKLSKSMSPSTQAEEQDMKSIPYREAVGAAGFTSVTIRPDISYSVAQVSQFLSRPGRKQWEAVKRIFRYLKYTQDEGIVLGTNDEQLTAYADSDWAGNTDNRRSTTGFAIQLFGGTISWTSRLQKVVSLSSTEAEYYAIGDCVKQITWIRSLLNELGFPQSTTTVHNDNQSAIHLLNSDEYRKRTKHIDVRHHFVREKNRKHEIEVKYIESGEQMADCLTKPLTEQHLNRCKQKLNIMSMTTALSLLCMFTLFAPTSGFQMAPPVTWTEAKEEVLRGQTVFSYELNMDIECHKFVNPWYMTRCLNRYQNEIVEILHNHCKGKVTGIQKRIVDPITLTIMGGVVFVGAIILNNFGVGVAALVKSEKLEDEVVSRFDTQYDVSERILAQIDDMRDKINNMTTTLGEREVRLLETTELASNMAVFRFHLKTMLIRFNLRAMDVEGLSLLNISLPSDVPVHSLRPMSCNFDLSNKTMTLRFVGNNVDQNQMILNASPITLYHMDGNTTCATVYNGSSRVMFDSSPNTRCKVREVLERDVYLHQTVNNTCKKAVESWTKGKCVENMDMRKTIQYKQVGYGFYVYCYGNLIHIFGTELECPDTPFFVPINESFILDGEKYVSKAGETKRLTPHMLTSYQHTINAHVEDLNNPYEIHVNNEEIWKILMQEKETLKRRHHWFTISGISIFGLMMIAWTAKQLFKKFYINRLTDSYVPAISSHTISSPN